MNRIKIKIPATSANLGPGFDTLGLAIDFCSTIEIQRAYTQSIKVFGEGANNPKIQENSMFLSIFQYHYKYLNNGKMDNFRFTFHNKIPISRGLGSSSIVILGAIYTAYRMSDIKISKRELLNLALRYEKHADNITPATYGGFCVSTLQNNKVFSLTKSIPSYLSALLVIPPVSMSTKNGRVILPEKYSKDDMIFNLSRSSLMVSAFFNQRWDLLYLASQDVVHEKYRMETLPELFNVKSKIHKLRPLMCTLSGSGSTIFSMFYEEDVQKARDRLIKQLPNNYKIIISKFNNHGIEQI